MGAYCDKSDQSLHREPAAASPKLQTLSALDRGAMQIPLAGFAQFYDDGQTSSTLLGPMQSTP